MEATEIMVKSGPSNALITSALKRHITAGQRLMGAATKKELRSVVNAKDDVAVLERELEMKWARAKTDPLAPFRMAGLRAKQRILKAEGGVCSDAEAAKRLGITCRALEKRRLARKAIGVELGETVVYPVWQFETAVARSLSRVLAALSEDVRDLEVLIFFLEPNACLDEVSPLDALRDGKRSAVIRAAITYGEQGSA